MPQSHVEIFILTYNRPEMLIEAVDSALAQDYNYFTVTVSDNSTDDRSEKLLEPYKTKKNFNYIRRKPSQPAVDHFNLNLKSSHADYFMLFHDDDVLLPNALTRMTQVLDTQPTTIAVAGNAYYIYQNDRKNEKMMKQIKKDFIVSNASELAEIYMRGLEHPAFPCYLYRTKQTQALELSTSQGGKYTDVSFLIKLAELGTICWLAECLMYYRIHGDNDSGQVDIDAVESLITFISSKNLTAQQSLDDFKMRNYFVWMKRGGLKLILSERFSFIILFFCAKYLLLNPRIVFKRLFRNLQKSS